MVIETKWRTVACHCRQSTTLKVASSILDMVKVCVVSLSKPMSYNKHLIKLTSYYRFHTQNKLLLTLNNIFVYLHFHYINYSY